MREMSMEMTKLGIIENMIEDTMEGMEPAGLEEQAQVIYFLTVEVPLIFRKKLIGYFGRLQLENLVKLLQLQIKHYHLALNLLKT